MAAQRPIEATIHIVRARGIAGLGRVVRDTDQAEELALDEYLGQFDVMAV